MKNNEIDIKVENDFSKTVLEKKDIVEANVMKNNEIDVKIKHDLNKDILKEIDIVQ